MTKKQIVLSVVFLIMLVTTTGFFINNEDVKAIFFTITAALFIGLIFSTAFKNVGVKKTLQQYENELKD